MSLNKYTLRDVIYEDLAQTDIVLEKEGDELVAPDEYFSNTVTGENYPYSVDINNKLTQVNPVANRGDEDYYDILTRRGTLRNPGKTNAPTPEEIAEYAITGVLPTSTEDTDSNVKKMRLQALEQHRVATVMSDRIVNHFLENLETKDAADNLVALRELVQYLVIRILTLTESIDSLATAANTQATATVQIVTVLQTVISALSTVAPALATQSTILNSINVSDIVTAAATANADMSKVLADLKGDFASNLINIKYNNSIKII